MHLFLVTRGINANVEMWKIFMQAQMYPWKRTNLKTGKEETIQVQGALRPIQLWEYIIPEESLPEVLTCLNKTKGYTGHWGDGKAKMMLPLFRKALGAKPIPKVDPVQTNRFIFQDGVGVEAVGIKEDKRFKWEDVGYEQEML